MKLWRGGGGKGGFSICAGRQGGVAAHPGTHLLPKWRLAMSSFSSCARCVRGAQGGGWKPVRGCCRRESRAATVLTSRQSKGRTHLRQVVVLVLLGGGPACSCSGGGTALRVRSAAVEERASAAAWAYPADRPQGHCSPQAACHLPCAHEAPTRPRSVQPFTFPARACPPWMPPTACFSCDERPS